MRQRPKRPALGSADVLTIELFTEPYIESSSSSSLPTMQSVIHFDHEPLKKGDDETTHRQALENVPSLKTWMWRHPNAGGIDVNGFVRLS